MAGILPPDQAIVTRHRDILNATPGYGNGEGGPVRRRPGTLLGGWGAFSSLSRFASNSPRLGTGMVAPTGVTWVSDSRRGVLMTKAEYPKLEPRYPYPFDYPDWIGGHLNRARQMLDRCRMSLADLHSPDLDRGMTGFCLIAVFGCAVTQTIQHIKTNVSPRSDFDLWWKLWRAEMSADPTLRFWWDLRTTFLKEGSLNVGLASGPLDNSDPPRRVWHLFGGPTTHFGQPVSDSVEELGQLYVAQLQRIHDAALTRWHKGIPVDLGAWVRGVPVTPPPGQG